MPKTNPFTPNNPVNSGMFVGRIPELDAIDKALNQTKNANPMHLLLLGERGIGKTSLLNAAKYFATGEFDWSDQKYNFLTIKISLTENLCLADFALSLKSEIERELNKKNLAIDLFKKCWNFLSRFEAAGISYKKEESSNNESQLIREFTYSLIDTVNFIKDPNSLVKSDGIVILIDESDKASKELHLGSFLKNLSESLSSEGANYILFILTGLPQTRDILIQSHESSLRLFQEFNLKPLSVTETIDVIQKGLDSYEKTSNIKVNITEKAKQFIHIYSEGYPHFVQQVGYSAFEVDADNLIDEIDVDKGYFMPNGALSQIGDRYYIKPFYKDITVESQREILKIMSDDWTNWVSRGKIKEKFLHKESDLDNSIRALIDKGIIIPKGGSRGQYKLQWTSFAIWIKNHDRVKQRN